MERPILSVTELNTLVKTLLDEEPLLGQIYVRGEISNYKLYPSGHHYFTLKDAESSIRCVMFRGSAASLRFRPENGMKILAFGRVSVFPRDGVYQLYCNELVADGIGDLHIAFEQLKQKLFSEGLFDAGHKKPLPQYPERIAVITSSAGAAVHDVIRVLRKRYPLARVILLPVRVQGAEAPPEIVGAIRYANRWQVADLLIVGRGGGSVEDLWCFNDERVARAIYDSEIPVISAVGHEPDVSISDFVADVRAATPSNAAELAVPDRSDLLRELRSRELRMAQVMQKKLEIQDHRLRGIAQRRAMQDPSVFLEDRRQNLDWLQSRLSSAGEKRLTREAERLAVFAASLDALSPLKVLSRGYSVVRDKQGRIIKESNAVSRGDRVDITLGRGWLCCSVEESGEDQR